MSKILKLSEQRLLNKIKKALSSAKILDNEDEGYRQGSKEYLAKFRFPGKQYIRVVSSMDTTDPVNPLISFEIVESIVRTPRDILELMNTPNYFEFVDPRLTNIMPKKNITDFLPSSE